MCVDVSFKVKVAEVGDYFPDIIIDPQVNLDFQAAHFPGPGVHGEYPVVIRKAGDNTLHLVLKEWGMVPTFAKTFEEGTELRNTYLNAKSERIFDKNSYWYDIRENRCLIPVSGIFEHRHVKHIRNAIPYHVGLKDRPLFCIPGLYCSATVADKDGVAHDIHSFAMITRAANTLMKEIHNSGDRKWRMPLFLPRELEDSWLDPALTDKEYKAILNYEMPSDALHYWTVKSFRTANKLPIAFRADQHEWPGLTPLGCDTIQYSLF